MLAGIAELRNFAAHYTAAWCSQDAASVAAFYSPDGSLTINGGSPASGRAAITAAAQSFMTEFPDLRVEMDDILIQDGAPRYCWTLTGTHVPSGRKVRISGFELWQIGPDGLIAASQGYFDSEDYCRQCEGP
jgi:steroid delta-isomerase-like uncharacterized protein